MRSPVTINATRTLSIPLSDILKGGVINEVFGMGVPELLIILVVVLLIFGPKNLPKLAAPSASPLKACARA